MRKKIRSSLSIKVFLWVFCALTICCATIYGIVLAFVPHNYQIVSDSQFEGNTNVLFSDLNNQTYDDAVEAIYNFCIENNSVALLERDHKTMTFGDFENTETDLSAASSYTSSLKFQGDSEESILSVIAVSKTADEIFTTLLQFIPVIFGIVILISALSSLICSKVIVAPIAKISRISRRMTELDMTWHCDTDRTDEIGVLSSSLNTMAARLKNTLSELETANQQLKLDVKKFQILEQQRRNFFTAVSHELKTPLTILKGQIENMLLGYGDYKNHEKYLPQALETTEDIEHLVKEILSITKMENMDISDSLQSVSLNRLLTQSVQDITPLSDQKSISIYNKITEEVTLSVHPELFSKVLSNVLGNAVRHSPAGAEVTIKLGSDSGSHVLTVENTGVSLAEENLEHLFTPFYRADKSRNKSTGGSGLGLYIVKTILELHGVDYQMRNTEKGVAFDIKWHD